MRPRSQEPERGHDTGAVLCLDEGLLAGTHVPMPEDVAWTDRDRVIACGRIRCRDCGELVRVFEGFALTRLPASKDEYEALFAAATPTAPGAVELLTQVGSGATSRAYACRCDAYSLGGNRTLKYGGPDAWTCDGHAAAEP